MRIEPGEIVVVGAGGHAKVVLSTLDAAGTPARAVFDDDPNKQGQRLLGVPIAGPLAELEARGDLVGVIAVGDNRARVAIARRLPLDWRTAVHPTAWVHPSVVLGAGTVVFAGAVVQPDTRIGHHAIVNTGATLDHDCELEDFVHVAPGVHLAGDVTLGEGAFLGIGSRVIPGRTVGAWSVVGAGATVIRDLSPGATAVGTPARTVERGRS